MCNEKSFIRIHQWLLCPRSYYVAYCLLDGWYKNELVHPDRKGTIRRLLFKLLCSLPIIILFVAIWGWHYYSSDELLKMSMTDYVIILLGIFGSMCLHEIVWGHIKRYLKKVLSYCSRKQTKKEFILATNMFCKIKKDDAAFLGNILGVLMPMAVSLFALAIISLKGLESQSVAVLKEWTLVTFFSIFLSGLITVTYSQYRFFSHLSVGLEMIIASKRNESNDIGE